MSDTYQATYDAVRSKLSGGDIGSAVESAVRDAQIGHYFQQACSAMAEDFGRPSAIYRPVVNRDGNQWCALYGANLQEGISGYGDSPALAMQDFDRKWHEKIKQKPTLLTIGLSADTLAVLAGLGIDDLEELMEWTADGLSRRAEQEGEWLPLPAVQAALSTHGLSLAKKEDVIAPTFASIELDDIVAEELQLRGVDTVEQLLTKNVDNLKERSNVEDVRDGQDIGCN